MKNFNAAVFAILAFSIIALGGCNSYRLGKPDIPFSTIHIATVGNDSFAPQILAPLSTELTRRFSSDGRIRLEDAARADVTLHVTILDYDRRPVAKRPDDTALGLSYSLEALALISLADNRNGTFYFEGDEVRADATAVASNDDLQAAEYHNIPVLARSLAERIAARVLSSW